MKDILCQTIVVSCIFPDSLEIIAVEIGLYDD